MRPMLGKFSWLWLFSASEPFCELERRVVWKTADGGSCPLLGPHPNWKLDLGYKSNLENYKYSTEAVIRAIKTALFFFTLRSV